MKSFFSKSGTNNAPELVTPTAFTSTSTNAIAMAPLSPGKHVVYFTPTQDCYIKFGTSSVGAATSSSWPLVANKRIRVIIANDCNYFTVIRKSSDGLLYWYVSGEVAPETPAQILGSNLIDEWNSDNATANSWASLNGRTISKSGTPTYGADGNQFGLHSVVGTKIAGPDYMKAGSFTGLPAAGSTPYVYCVIRDTSLSISVAGSFGTSTTDLVYVLTFGGNLKAVYGSTQTTLAAANSNVNFIEMWSTGTVVGSSLNGSDTLTTATETLASNMTKFSCGSKVNLDDAPFEGFHARWGICTSVPSTEQRAKLLNYFRRTYGF